MDDITHLNADKIDYMEGYFENRLETLNKSFNLNDWRSIHDFYDTIDDIRLEFKEVIIDGIEEGLPSIDMYNEHVASYGKYIND